MTKPREPWSKFYWADWRANKELRLCSLSARGLWMEMLCLMHEATPYGHLLIGGRAPTVAQIAMQVAAPLGAVKKAMAELEAAGVADIVDGVWISRRMVRDAHRRAVNQTNGSAGGNPKLTDKPSDNRTGYPNRLTEPDKPSDKSHDARDPEARSQIPEGEIVPPPPVSVSVREPTENPEAQARALLPLVTAALGPAPNASPCWLVYGSLRELIEAGASEELILDTCRDIAAKAVPGSIGSWAYVRTAVNNAMSRKSADVEGEQAESQRRSDRIARVVAGLASRPGGGDFGMPGGDAGPALSAVPG